MVKNVDPVILGSFVPLIPKEHIPELESGQMFCLGALKEEDGESVPVGVLLFSVEEGTTNGIEPATMIVLQWIYVAEEYRTQGFANELMDALSDVLDDSPAEGIICDIPLDSEYDLAEAFFASWGFQFEVVDTNEMIITKDDCRRQAASKYTEEELRIRVNSEKPKEMVSVFDIPREVFRETVQKAKEMEKSGSYDLISEDREDYAGDMSYAIMHGDEISSFVLVERLPDDDLHVVMLSGFGPDAARELLKLMQYTAIYYFENYPEETRIHLTLASERSVNLAVHLFPDIDSERARRGFFY